MLIVRLTDDPESLMQGLRERVARLISEPYTGEALLGRGGFDESILGPVRELVGRGDEAGASRYVSEELAEACYLLGDAVALPGADSGVRGRWAWTVRCCFRDWRGSGRRWRVLVRECSEACRA